MHIASTLLLVDGAAGTGKTDMIEYLARGYRQKGKVGIVRKRTTRSRRLDERRKKLSLDLEFVSDSEFDAIAGSRDFYQYEYGGWRYGFTRTQIAQSLADNEVTVLIVRSSSTIRKLKEDFRWALVVVVYVHSDMERVVERLNDEGYDQNYIKLRLERGHIAWSDYLKHPDLYDRVLLNCGTRVDFERLVESLIEDIGNEPSDEFIVDGESAFTLPPSLVGRKLSMVHRLKMSDYARNVFLMMKFRSSNHATWEFIRDTLNERGFNCVRADQKEWNITKDVYNPVAVLFCCKYGIALFDEAEDGAYYSPNVAYELGIMHHQKKDCLILRHGSLPQPPFDLIKNLHVVYSRDIELRAAVLRWLDEISHDRGTT